MIQPLTEHGLALQDRVYDLERLCTRQRATIQRQASRLKQKISMSKEQGYQYFSLTLTNSKIIRLFVDTVFEGDQQKVALFEVQIYGQMIE